MKSLKNNIVFFSIIFALVIISVTGLYTSFVDFKNNNEGKISKKTSNGIEYLMEDIVKTTSNTSISGK